MKVKHGFCPEDVILILKQNPHETAALIEILNGKHYTIMDVTGLLIKVITLVAKSLKPTFDPAVLLKHYDSEEIESEKYSSYFVNF